MDRIQKARTLLLLDHAFFGALIFKLKPVQSRQISTMATDGKSLFFNPRFLEEIAPEQLIGTLAHEVMHPALGHHTRRGDRDPKLWNMACDYAINPILIDAGLKLPDGILNDRRFRNMSAEQIYNILAQEQEQGNPQNNSGNQQQQSSGSGSQQQEPSGSGASSQQQQQAGSNDGNGTPSPDNSSQPGQPNQPGTEDADGPQDIQSPGGIGQILDAPNEEDPGQQLSDAQRSSEEADWKAAVHQAAAVSKMAGNMPHGIERALKEAAEAQVDWTDRFQRSFAATIPNDYSWMRPNRRFIHSGMYLPGITREGVGELAVGIDCSGSVSDRQLEQFAGEINTIIDEHKPERVHVLYFDDVIQRHDTYACGEQITLTRYGEGGTNFDPIFMEIDELGLQPQAVVVLTDLYGPCTVEDPGYPVLWVSTGRREAPFGETIPITAA
jgi:predicted metal-dependent peptidase